MTVTTDGGTTFKVAEGKLTITRSDQPEWTGPLSDLVEFVRLYYDAEAGDDDNFGDDE